MYLMEHCLIAAHGYFVDAGNSDLNDYVNERLPKDSYFKLLHRITVRLLSLGFCAAQPLFPSYSTQGNDN